LFIQSAKANAEHDFSLIYLDQRRQAAVAVAFCINRPLLDNHKRCMVFRWGNHRT